jgi:hypothetical protein
MGQGGDEKDRAELSSWRGRRETVCWLELGEEGAHS